MKTIILYEPALCCETGTCGLCVSTEPIRITSIAKNLKRNGVILQRYNLKSAPQEFDSNTDIHKLINDKGVDSLPATIVDGKIVKTKEYPMVEEIAMWLDIPVDYCLTEKDNNR